MVAVARGDACVLRSDGEDDVQGWVGELGLKPAHCLPSPPMTGVLHQPQYCWAMQSGQVV